MHEDSPASARRLVTAPLRVVQGEPLPAPLLATEPQRLSSTPPAPGPLRVAARRKESVVFLEVGEVWAFEADARLTFVHCALGRLDIDVSLAEIEASALGTSFVRVHRSWLANFEAVRALDHRPGRTELFLGTKVGDRHGVRAPVSRDRLRLVRQRLLAGTIGLRRREDGPEESAGDSDVYG